MKGAFLVSEDTNLASLVLAAMEGVGAEVAPDGVAQIRDDEGRLFTVFAHPDPASDWEWRSGSVTPTDDGLQPDLATASACWIECRWEVLFADLVRTLARALPGDSWVLDGDGVLWSAADVDPTRVRL
jgi:hypothetical protein